MAREERRRYQRVTLPSPLRGTIGTTRVFVVDVSIGGVRVAHQDPIAKPGQPCTLKFDGPTGPIVLNFVAAWTEVHRRAERAEEKSVHHTGLMLGTSPSIYDAAFRELISYFVERALDEQRANARGIPATAALSFQTGKGTDFVRFDFVAGRWRRTVTKDTKQPANGFTVSAAETDDSIEQLCEAYEAGDAEARKLIRLMAEMSISKTEGIPTRRYEP